MSVKKSQSDPMIMGMETSAISVLARAIEHDEQKRYPAALACYQEAIQLYINVIKHTADKSKRDALRVKATEYITRAEKIKEIVQKQKDLETYHDQIQIPDNGTGYTYESLFKKYLDDTVTRAEIEDPYIRTNHQTYNFLGFCELLVKYCPKLSCIHLTTGYNENEQGNQNSRFQSIKQSLQDHKVMLEIEYSSTLHDREIRLDNGWVIKIGRGLDIFKGVKKFAIGTCDQSLRHCHETTIDVFYKGK